MAEGCSWHDPHSSQDSPGKALGAQDQGQQGCVGQFGLEGLFGAIQADDYTGKWFFPSPKVKHYDPDNFSRDLRNANLKASLKWTCLDYRHTFGSQLAINRESLYKKGA